MGLPPDKYKKTVLLADLLHQWLADQILPDNMLIDKFLEKLQNIDNLRDFCLYPREETAVPAAVPLKAEVFYGLEGKQKGVLKFLSAVLKQKAPCTLLLYSDESMEWFRDDRAFLANFISLFFEVIKKGNRVKIIHTISRDISEMFAAIDFWLPFYMTGAIEPYYCPRYREHYFRRTMFIAPGIASLTSATLHGLEKKAANLLSTDINFIKTLTWEFNEYLNMCRPLMRVFAGTKSAQLENLLTEFAGQVGDCFRLSNALSVNTMPEELLVRLLDRWVSDKRTKEKILSVQNTRKQAFINNLRHHYYTEIITLPSPQEIKSGQVPVEMPELTGTPVLFYSPKEYQLHLEHILHLLESYNNYRLFLCHRSFHRDISLTVKDETGVIIIKKDPPFTFFTINQPNMTNAFYCYLEDFINGIPLKSRDKLEILSLLKALCHDIGKNGP